MSASFGARPVSAGSPAEDDGWWQRETSVPRSSVMWTAARVLCKLCESVHVGKAFFFVSSEDSIWLHLDFVVFLVGALSGATGHLRVSM